LYSKNEIGGIYMNKGKLFRVKLTALIAAALGTCTFGGMTVSAAYNPAYGNIVNMTDQGDLTIDKYEAGQNTLYIYSHSASDPTQVTGGSVTVNSADRDSSGNQAQIYLRTDSSGIDMSNSSTVSSIMLSLTKQITYSGYIGYAENNLNATVEIAEGITGSSFIQRASNIQFDSATGQGKGMYEEYKANQFKTVITGDLKKDIEYSPYAKIRTGYILKDPNSPGEYRTKQSYEVEAANLFRPEVISTSKGGNFAVIQPDSGQYFFVGASNGGDMTTTFDLTGIQSNQGNIYAIYNDKPAGVGIMALLGISVITPSDVSSYRGFIYAGNACSDNSKSVVQIDNGSAPISIHSYNSAFVGIESGHNGNIFISGPLDIQVGKNTYGLKAEDGGSIQLTGSDYSTISIIDADGGTAAYAANGGKIQFLSSYINGNVETVGDDSHIIVGIKNGRSPFSSSGRIGQWDGDAIGHVDVNLNTDSSGQWNGDFKSDGIVTIGKGTWNGNIDKDEGDVTVYSQGTWNGGFTASGKLSLMGKSVWNNTVEKASEITHFSGVDNKGLRGIIFSKGDVNFDKYSGMSLIGYQHGSSDPTQILGGNVTIKSSDPEAAISLRTDSSGIDIDNHELVENILKNMAQKLTYTGYLTGERNLSATTEIAEGLTAGARSLYIADVSFDDSNGRGILAKYVTAPFNGVVTGDPTIDTIYVKRGIMNISGDQAIYNFKEKTIINNSTDVQGATPDPSNMKYAIAVNPIADREIIFNMNGNDLSIENYIGQGSMSQSTEAVLYALNKNSSIVINDPGKIDLTAFAQTFYAGGIAAGNRYGVTDKPNSIIINNKADWDHAVKIRGTMGMGGVSSSSIFNINWTGIKCFNQGQVDIKGYADISSYGAWSLSAIGNQGWIKIGGGKIASENYAAVDVYGAGQVYLNAQGNGADMTAGDNVLMIEGNLRGSGQFVGNGSGGYINAAFTTSDSYWAGIANAAGGWISLAIQDGAVWTNQDGGFQYGSSTSSDKTLQSNVDYLYGSSDKQADGVIYQKQDGDITVNHYQGSTTVYYDHNSSNPIQMTGGDFVVESASKNGNDNAVITMKTDNSGIDTKDSSLITRVLNSLAGKLIYDGYTSGERNLTGYAEISEGLTSSSILKKESIIFDENSGAGRVSKDPLGQTKTLFETSLTGDNSADTEYKRAGVLKDGSYTFSDATVIQGGTKSVQGGNFDKTGIMAAIPASGAEQTSKDITVNAGQGLHIDMSKTQGVMRLAGVYTGNGAQLLVDGALSVNVVNSFTNGSALGIAQDLISSTGHRSAVTVNGDVDISIKNQITDGTGQLGSFTPRSETIVGIRNGDGSGSSITVNGMADIDVEGTGIIADNKTDSSGFIAVRGGVVKAQKVAIGDDTFLNNHALAAYAGTIYAGMEKDESGAWNPGTSRVEMEGNILTMRDLTDTSGARSNLLDGTVNLALVTPNSYWKGIADNGGTDKLGTLNLALQNGGLWINEKQGGTYDYSNQWDSSDVLNGTWDGVSHVTTLTGGADERARGIVSQTEDTPISIDHYSGHTLVVYGHITPRIRHRLLEEA
jgi:hypothetical protein